MEIPKTIVLFDALHSLTVHFKAMAKDAGPNNAAQATLDLLSEVRKMGHVILCMDSPPYWRTKLHPEYKARRDREPEFGHIVKWFLERAESDGYHIASCAGTESDDVIYTLCKEYSESGVRDIRVVSEDKDLTQCLVFEGVQIWVYKGRGEWEMRDSEYVRKRYGVEPKDMALYLAIVGDKSDNVPGIANLGPEFAKKAINAYKNPAGIAVALAAAVDAAKEPGAKPLAAVWRHYAAGMSRLNDWIQLTRLGHVMVRPRSDELIVPKQIRPLVEAEPLDGEPDWDAIEEQVEAITREAMQNEMASALPVERAPLTEPERDPAERRAAMAAAGEKEFGAPIIGKDPKADEFLKGFAEKQAGKDMAEDPRNVEPTKAGKQINEIITRPAPGAAANTPQAAGAADPKAAASAAAGPSASVPSQASATADSSPRPAPSDSPSVSAASAEVVPKTRGPRKVDGIPEPDASAIVHVAPPSWALASQPRTAGEMLAIAKHLLNSRACSAYGTPEAVFNAIALGRELGLGFATSLDAFHLYNNKPLLKAVTYKALAEQHPDCEWIVITSADKTHATIKTKHRHLGVLEYTYTSERAREAGYFTGGNRENWNNKTQEMLEARATTKAIRRWYAGVIVGRRALEEEQDGAD